MSGTITAGFPFRSSRGRFAQSDPQSEFKDNLGPLAELAGTWVGNGFNVMSVPDFDSKAPSMRPEDVPS